MERLITIINNLDSATAIGCADQVAQQLTRKLETSDIAIDQKEYIPLLIRTFPEFSESLRDIEAGNLEIKEKISKNFLIVMVKQNYSDLVKDAILNPQKFEPITLIFIASAIVFVLESKVGANLERDKDGKISFSIHIDKEKTSESMIKAILGLGGRA